MTIPNGWHIKYNPKPIPIRGHDWDFWHDEVDNDSRLCGTAGSEEDAKLAIMEKQAERYGFDKHADKPDAFDSHINIESLQQRIATLEAACEASARWYKFHKRGFPIATPQAEELMVHYLRAAGYLK